MFLPTDLSFQACLPPRQATAQWYLDVLRSLWEHGIAYNSGYTWEQTLASADCSFSFLETTGPSKGTLSMFVDQLLTLESNDAGFLTAVAEHVPLKIGFGTEQSNVLADWVYVAIERFRLWLRLPPDQLGAQRIPYTHVFRTVVDVSALLCEATKPLFGFGYDSGSVQDREGLIDVDEIARDVFAGRLPDMSQWLDPAPFEYIEPSFLTNEHLLQLLAMPHVQVQQLATGGILVVPPYSPYTFEDSNAVIHYNHGEDRRIVVSLAASGQDRTHKMTELQQVGREGIGHYGRAHTIWESIHNQRGAEGADRRMRELEQLLTGVSDEGVS